MKYTSKAEFFKAMNPLDVHPHPQGPYPYTTLWKLRCGRLIGKSVARVERGREMTSWYLLISPYDP
jgi:hypothetical protein